MDYIWHAFIFLMWWFVLSDTFLKGHQVLSFLMALVMAPVSIVIGQLVTGGQ